MQIDIKKTGKFYFESNQFFKVIETQADITKMMELVPDFAQARKNVYIKNADYPSFGFYQEYNGKVTLGDWIKTKI